MNHVLLNKAYEFVSENDKCTSFDVGKHLGVKKSHACGVLLKLQRMGYLTYINERTRHPFKLFSITDKPWIPQTKKEKPAPPLIDKVEIMVQPDIAAAWVNPSLRPLGKKWIPIVRSIGLGVRQST